MKVWECRICGFVYDKEKGDPSSGIAPGTSFEEVPGEWRCPLCNATKDYSFFEIDEEKSTPQNRNDE